MNIEVSDENGLQLEQLAKERNLTIDELISAMLERYDVKRRKSVTLADMAANAVKANLATPHPVNTSERSREILQTEFAEYLNRRKTQ